MDIERKCLTCWFSAEDSAPKQQPQLIGQRTYMCLANPPTSSALPTGNGGLALIASYPQINKDSISCARWTPVPSKDVRETIAKAARLSNDRNFSNQPKGNDDGNP